MTVDASAMIPSPAATMATSCSPWQKPITWPPHALMRLNNISREFTDAVVIDSGKVVEEKCVPELIQKGTVTGEKAEGVYLSSNAESFNGILVTGDQPIW